MKDKYGITIIMTSENSRQTTLEEFGFVFE